MLGDEKGWKRTRWFYLLDDLLKLLNDLPRAYGRPILDGRFRSKSADFCVDEVLGFDPAGHGEHLYLHICKRDMTTQQVAQRLSEVTGCPLRLISYAGLKDRYGICTQWFSIHDAQLSAESCLRAESELLTIRSIQRNTRKLRRGVHAGNRFRIVIRDLSLRTPSVLAHVSRQSLTDQAMLQMSLDSRLQAIVSEGVPNYFGEQRFGHDNVHQLERLFAGTGKTSRNRRSILLSAARSALFNALLADRVAVGKWNACLEGDVFNLSGSGSIFVPDMIDDTIQQRVRNLDIHPTGMLWGQGELLSRGLCRELELAIASRWPVLRDGLETAGLTQQRRSLRLMPQNLTASLHADQSVELDFFLPTGTYATAVLHELLDYRTEVDV